MRRTFLALLAVALTVCVAACDVLPIDRPAGSGVLLIVLGADADGTTVPVSIVTIAPRDVVEAEAVDPRMKVTVPGTSYDRLRDAYPFAGGPGVTAALASATGVDPLPFILLSDTDTATLLGDAGATVALTVATAAYREGTLYRLPAGRHRYAGDELRALLASVDYIAEADRALVENTIAEAVAQAVARDPNALSRVLDADPAATDLSASAVQSFAGSLGEAGDGLSFTAYR